MTSITNGVRILVVIPVISEMPVGLLRDLSLQTIRPELVVIAAASNSVCRRIRDIGSDIGKMKVECIVTRPDMKEHVGIRVGKAINQSLRHINLVSFDYFLKIDADVNIPNNYLQKCLALNADLVGLGPFMLIRMKTFLKLFDGKWPETPADDAHISIKLYCFGYKIERWPQGIRLKREGGISGRWTYYYLRGKDEFKLGIEPFHELRNVFHLAKSRRTLLPVFTLIGYLIALITGVELYEFSYIFFHQTFKSFLRRLKIRY